MFDWLFNLFRRKPKRAIFRYYDGRRWRVADALRAYRLLSEHPVYRMAEDPQLIDAGSVKALARLIGAHREVFHIPPFEAEGLTDDEVAKLAADFVNFLVSVKKNFVLRAISGQSSAA